MPDAAAAESTIRRLFDAFNRRDADATGALHAPDSVVYDPGFPEPLRGRQTIQDEAAAWFTAAPDTTMEALRFWANDTGVAAEVRITGHQTGPLGDLPPTGNAFEQWAVAAWRVNADGLITEEVRYYSPAAIQSQLAP